MNSYQLPSVGKNPIANSYQLPSVGKNPIANSYQLPSVGKNSIANSYQLPSVGKNPIANSYQLPSVGKNSIANSYQLPSVGKKSIANSYQLALGRKKNTVVGLTTVFWGGCAGYLNVRLPCCGLGRTMISRCRAVDSTFLATAATSCGVSVRKMGATLALSSGVSSSPVSA